MYIVGLTKLINKNEFGEVEMKKSSAFVMVVPGLGHPGGVSVSSAFEGSGPHALCR